MSRAFRFPVTSQIDLLPSLPAYQPTRLPVLDERNRGTRFIGLPVSSVLNTPASTGMGFWSINPYVGCEFGCTYCYARDTHKWTMERAGGRTGGQVDGRTGGRTIANREAVKENDPEEAFEKEILVKTDVAEVLARTLNPARLAGHSLVIGTATDPYQPAEGSSTHPPNLEGCLLHGLSIASSPSRRSSPVTWTSQASPSARGTSTSHSPPRTPAGAAARARSPVPAARLRALRRLTEAAPRRTPGGTDHSGSDGRLAGWPG